jgi:hypothetical protein
MPDRTLRNDDTPEGQKIWDKVDRAAEDAPKWVKDRLKESERPPAKERSEGDGNT